MLEFYLRGRLSEKEILLMTHVVLGYPSFEDCFRMIEEMVKAGVDLMELQVPFSEPIADGVTILRANQRALEKGVTVQRCLDFADEVTRVFDIPFLIMTYYNIPFKYGVERFVHAMAKRSIRGAIIPDLPPEEGRVYLNAMLGHNLAPVLMFTPTTPDSRMRYIASFSKGFNYCVARGGVTGAKTVFSEELSGYLDRCRRASPLPLAVGFGVNEKADVDFLRGKADIAVIGTQIIRQWERGGIGSVADFIRHLR